MSLGQRSTFSSRLKRPSKAVSRKSWGKEQGMKTVSLLLTLASLAFSAFGAEERPILPHVDDPKIVAQIRDIPDNTSVLLPPYSLAGQGVDEWRKKWGYPPQRRDYCNKLAYAPDRRTGMYCGMNHGVPHRLNDAWEYHLGSNTWHLLFAPDDINFSDMMYSVKPGQWLYREEAIKWLGENVVVKDGYIQSKRGGMINGVHTWDGLTYDPVLKRMLWANVVGAIDNAHPKLLESVHLKKLEQQAGPFVRQLREEVNTNGKQGTRLWMYDPKESRWIMQIGPAPHPLLKEGGGSLTYVSDLKKTIWYSSCSEEWGMWAYDSEKNTWEDLKPNGGKAIYHDLGKTFPKREQQALYSSKHRKIVAVRGARTWWYDIDKNEWSVACDDEANAASDASTVFVYDSINDVFLLSQYKTKTLRAYRIEANKWETLAPQGAGVAGDGAGYFDPEANAFVIFQKGQKSMWVYRFKRATK